MAACAVTGSSAHSLATKLGDISKEEKKKVTKSETENKKKTREKKKKKSYGGQRLLFTRPPQFWDSRLTCFFFF